MSKRLEKFIEMNREEFDDLEPSAGLWQQIEKHLPEPVKKHEVKTFSLGFVMRVAASVVLLMGIGFAVYLKSAKKQEINLAAINPVYARQQVKYTSLIETKRMELKSISASDPQLYKEFSAEISKLDATYKQLNNELTNSPNQERVLRAMIRNLEVQTEVLNQQLNVIGQFNQLKEEQKHEDKNI